MRPTVWVVRDTGASLAIVDMQHDVPTSAAEGYSTELASGRLRAMSALGQKRTSRAKIHLCPLLSKSGQTLVRLHCPLCANSGHCDGYF
jgi:hypothetical protein